MRTHRCPVNGWWVTCAAFVALASGCREFPPVDPQHVPQQGGPTAVDVQRGPPGSELQPAPSVPERRTEFGPAPADAQPAVPSSHGWPRPCHPLFAEDFVPHFEVELDPGDLSAMKADNQRSGKDREERYYPIVFRHEGEVVTTAMIRLRGNNSDCGDLMQFAISFNQVDPAGRFRGLRRINLDHGGCRLLAERLALSFAREDLGLPAACANHATLSINGERYGLFTHLEHVNKDFLKRNFPDPGDDGNLYKSGHRLRTNEEEGDPGDRDDFFEVRDYAELAGVMDVEEAVTEWAGEAVLPAPDNYWLHGWNYYLYAHPTRGYLFIPTDLDRAFPSSASADFMFPSSPEHHADVVLSDPAGRARYEAALLRAIAAFDAERLVARLERWWVVLEPEVRRDPHRAYDEAELEELSDRVRARARWLRDWAAERGSPHE